MDLVDKKNVVGLQVGELRREIAGRAALKAANAAPTRVALNFPKAGSGA